MVMVSKCNHVYEAPCMLGHNKLKGKKVTNTNQNTNTLRPVEGRYETCLDLTTVMVIAVTVEIAKISSGKADFISLVDGASSTTKHVGIQVVSSTKHMASRKLGHHHKHHQEYYSNGMTLTLSHLRYTPARSFVAVCSSDRELASSVLMKIEWCWCCEKFQNLIIADNFTRQIPTWIR
ncbi:unnamed protein product [Prunus armeniaca]|uniref:Uncharacterized protein n=1 Tax=Prunus armeniaca TaxID=36596 RepID=A0A6J5UE67_PRUAR|nr:unnamed protein product [Prunus armeniaca]